MFLLIESSFATSSTVYVLFSGAMFTSRFLLSYDTAGAIFSISPPFNRKNRPAKYYFFLFYHFSAASVFIFPKVYLLFINHIVIYIKSLYYIILNSNVSTDGNKIVTLNYKMIIHCFRVLSNFTHIRSVLSVHDL